MASESLGENAPSALSVGPGSNLSGEARAGLSVGPGSNLSGEGRAGLSDEPRSVSESGRPSLARRAATSIRLTLKQHRFEVTAVAVLAALTAAGAFVDAFRLNVIAAPAACNSSLAYLASNVDMGGQLPDPNGCLAASRAFAPIVHGVDMAAVNMLLAIFPFVAGITLGAPIVAREVEQGTAPLSWALSPSRKRWLTGKTLAMTVVLLATLAVVGVAGDSLFGAANRGQDAHAYLGDVHVPRGAMVFGWGLAAFAGTLALGTLLRRTLPAVFIALVVCVLAVAGFSTFIDRMVLPPFATAQFAPTADASPGFDYVGHLGDHAVYYANYLHGDRITDEEVNAWYQAHQVTTVDASGNVSISQPIDSEEAPVNVAFVIAGSRYWWLIGLESAVLLGGALCCALIAFAAIDRRRPY